MKHTKFEWMPLYSYLDRTAITAHLSDMAAQGWMLEKIGGWNWRYRRTEPKKLRFALVFFPASQFDPGPSEGLETYRDYCAAAGWQLAAEASQVQIFCTGDETAVPIETDPAVELANIRRCVKRGFVGSYWALLALSLFQILFQFYQIWTNPVDTLSSTASRRLTPNMEIFPQDKVNILGYRILSKKKAKLGTFYLLYQFYWQIYGEINVPMHQNREKQQQKHVLSPKWRRKGRGILQNIHLTFYSKSRCAFAHAPSPATSRAGVRRGGTRHTCSSDCNGQRPHVRGHTSALIRQAARGEPELPVSARRLRDSGHTTATRADALREAFANVGSELVCCILYLSPYCFSI